MRNDAGLHARSPRTGRNSSFFPTSLRAISSYLRNVSVNASNIAATVRSAGASVASTVSLAEEERQREQIQWAGFDSLELGPHSIRHVLLLTYLNGFQVWDVEEADLVQELVSKRDGPVGFLRIQPRPYTNEHCDGGLKFGQPLLLVVTGDVASFNSGAVPDGCTNGNVGGIGGPPTAGGSHFVPTIVRFYSLCSHTYVYKLKFRTAIYAVRCSPRAVVVALIAQIYCFDAATLKNTFSVLTYPSPQAGPGGPNIGYGAMAVGPRWLAYAANQPLISNTGRVSPQHLTPSPGVSPSTSPANGSLVAHYAKESSKHIAAGIVTLGDMGYKTLSRYYSELLPDGASSPGSGSPNWKSTNSGLGVHSYDPEHVGTVIVRDFVSKTVIAQFRAHTSPLSAICFDPSGTLLVTASVHGHNLNVFRLTPSLTGSSANSTCFDANASYVHLYKLCRGITPAIIQDISFSGDSHWIAISSSRGTSHLFAISPFGGIVGPHTHGLLPVTGVPGIVTPVPAFPWWSSSGQLKSNQQTFLPPPPAVTLSVVSRIKNGNGGWRGTVSGAAAAATGRNPSSGAVAVFFHDGRDKNLESEVGHSGLKDQLWVLSPPGHLIRYALRPSSAGTDGVYHNDGSFSTGGVNSSEAQDLRVIVEPLQKWDVCRRPNWVEREDRIDIFGSSGGLSDETNVKETYKNSTTNARVSGSGRVAKESMREEEMHRWYLSNAEVQMHQAKPPIWVKSEISFHVFMGASSDEPLGIDDLGGEIAIEKAPSRVVEVRRKDLVPVFEPPQNLRGAQGTRDPVLEVLPGSLRLSKDDNLQDGFISTHVGCLQIRRSSSGSSSGSEGGLFGGTTTVLNGFHYPYQDLQDVQTVGIPSYDDLATSFSHQTRLGYLHSDKAISQFGHVPNHNGSKPILASQEASTCAVIGSPPMDIPRQGRWVAHGKAHPFLNAAEIKPSSLQTCGVMLPNVKDESQVTKTNPINDITGQLDATSSSRRASMVGVNCPMSCEDLKHESKGEAAIIFGDERGHPQSYDAAVEDVESTDANSKTDDFEGGDQGEDVWEGTMFPFAEDS